MNVHKTPFGGNFKLPSFSDFRRWFRGKFGYMSREEEIPYECFPISRDPPFPSPILPIILPLYFNRRDIAQY